MKKIFIINSIDDKDLRFDKWLKLKFSSLNQSFIEKNIRKENIKINNKKTISKHKLKLKDEIIIFNYNSQIYSHQPTVLSKKVIPLKYKEIFNSSIIFENKNFLIIDKWSGIATQGGSKINISIDHLIKSISESYKLVHRLDRETSGLLIIAKNLQSTKLFGKIFRDHLITKVYIAICQGIPKNIESEVNITIDDKKNSNKKIETITRYKVCQTKNKLSNIVFIPFTGKTHQLRIVSKHLGCPIIGDSKYNKQDSYNSEKLKLNAHILKFTINNKDYEFVSELPLHFKEFMAKNKLQKITINQIDNFL